MSHTLKYSNWNLDIVSHSPIGVIVSDVRLLASELARHLSVSQTTITNWATKRRPPLAFHMDQGRRRFTLDDYARFAMAHPTLRGVAKQRSENRTGTAAPNVDPHQCLMEMRERLQNLLEQVDAVRDGSDKAQRSAVKLRREITTALKLLPETNAVGEEVT